jgi:hypothetical protein
MGIRLAALAGIALTSCSGGGKDDAATQPLEVLAAAEYVIGYGETVAVGGGLSLEFTTLAEESRCPVDVTCIWEGNTRVLMTWRSPRGEGIFELNTHPSRQTSATADSRSVTLRKLEPYPGTAPPTGAGSDPASGYEATVFVDPTLSHDSSQGPQ